MTFLYYRIIASAGSNNLCKSRITFVPTHTNSCFRCFLHWFYSKYFSILPVFIWVSSVLSLRFHDDWAVFDVFYIGSTVNISVFYLFLFGFRLQARWLMCAAAAMIAAAAAAVVVVVMQKASEAVGWVAINYEVNDTRWNGGRYVFLEKNVSWHNVIWLIQAMNGTFKHASIP